MRKKGSDVWEAGGTYFFPCRTPEALLKNCHIFYNLQQICHTYIYLYIIAIRQLCGRLADFQGKNFCIERARELICKTRIIYSELLHT